MPYESILEQMRAVIARVLRELRGGMPPFSDDPLAGVREPRPRTPGGRSSAAAVDEPWEIPEGSDAVGAGETSNRKRTLPA